MKKVNDKVKKIIHGIKTMKLRGAGRIASSAAEALVITAQESKVRSPSKLIDELEVTTRLLLKTRPTAVSLPNAVRYIMHKVKIAQQENTGLEDLRQITIEAGSAFIQNSKRAIDQIGEIGAKRIEDGDCIITHCNSAAVTTVLTTAFNQGKNFEVFISETRPRFQGRITAKALSDVGVATTLIVDNAVRYFMAKMDKSIVGADAVAANGAVVNKIGTSMMALAADESRVPFFVAAETYKFSPETMMGRLVKIEERDPFEVLSKEKLKELPKVRIRNPSFDVTPPEYIDLIITEKGIIPPQAAIIIIKEQFGSITSEELREYQTYMTAKKEER